MPRPRKHYAFPNHRPVMIDNFDQSRFWLRLDELSRIEKTGGRKAAIDHLKASIRKVTERAKWISTQVCRFMPQYTMHEERHFLNVLAIMDALVPDDVVARFAPLDCALPILAAYTHDLGMALSQDEYDLLHDASTAQGKHFAGYTARFDDELRHVQRWIARRDQLTQHTGPDSQREVAAVQKRIDSIHGYILASYLRSTHTEDDHVRRLRRWLHAIKADTADGNVFRYGVHGKDYEHELILIGLSHAHEASWLRRKLIDGGPDDRFFQPVATGESTNLAFPSLLLRLADLLDFDASRAPRILFTHFGIDDDQSVLEWNKHLSVFGWVLNVDPYGKHQSDILYSAESQHPVHEKAIREFKVYIDTELSAVRAELDAQRRQLPAAAQTLCDLHLPSEARLDVRAARDPRTGQPKYIYHDLQFHLDQHEVQNLLMGETLYGDPSLCIRELIQNSLDALELRELRLKMKHKSDSYARLNGERTRPGWVRESDGREDELRVMLDWGVDEHTGQYWLRVADNGVGMTLDVIKKYFTQIGKSFYRSPEFNQERAVLKAAGEIASPISIFGIGILSCFMIAERLVVRTLSTADSGEQPLDVTISGAGSLFWVTPGTSKSPGTELTLWLKRKFHFSPKRRNNTSETMLAVKEYEDKNRFRVHPLRDESSPLVIDPVLVCAETARWPNYPILIRQPGSPEIRIDKRFYDIPPFTIDSPAIRDTAQKLGCPPRMIGEPRWDKWEWHDNVGLDATGSHVRLIFITNRDERLGSIFAETPSRMCRLSELALFAFPQTEPLKGIRILVNGMHIRYGGICNRVIPFECGVSTEVWVDFRGEAAPRLTANRDSAIAPEDEDAWKSAVSKMFRRFALALQSELEPLGEAVQNDVASLIKWTDAKCIPIETQDIVAEWKFASAIAPSWGMNDTPDMFRAAIQLLPLYVTRGRDWVMDGSPSRLERFQKAVDNGTGVFCSKREKYREFIHWCVGSDAHNMTFVNRGEKMSPRKAIHDHLRRARENGRYFDFDFWECHGNLVMCAGASLIDAYVSKERTSRCPILGLSTVECLICDGALNGPGVVTLFSASSKKPEIQSQLELARWGYDITFPMLAMPLPRLREECLRWHSESLYRGFGVAPFLLPSLANVWRDHAEFLQETFPTSHIYCFLPRFELWSKRFCDWTEDDWRHTANLSVLWDISGSLTGGAGKVLWACGAREIDEMCWFGLPAPEFLMATGK